MAKKENLKPSILLGFEILKMHIVLKGGGGQYRYYLRHYSPTIIETVLYVVPV